MINKTETIKAIQEALVNANDFMLVQVAEVLNTKVVSVFDRPNFGHEQVRHPCQLKAGLKYKLMYRDNEKHFTVLSDPYIENGVWYIKVTYSSLNPINLPVVLNYANVFPWPSGKWDDACWIAFTDSSRHLANQA